MTPFLAKSNLIALTQKSGQRLMSTLGLVIVDTAFDQKNRKLKLCYVSKFSRLLISGVPGSLFENNESMCIH